MPARRNTPRRRTQSALKPCPFCGEKEELYPGYHDLGRSGPFSIQCLGCGIVVQPPNGIDIVTAWNRRDGKEEGEAA